MTDDRPLPLLETLEGRTLFAGNVTASVVEARLFLRGDAKNNVIKITEGLNEGEIRVQGFKKTKIDRGRDARVFSGGITDVRIMLRGGDDLVRVNGVDITGDLRIKTGTGRDIVVVRDVGVSAELRVNTLQGKDRVRLDRVTVGNRARVRGGSFADRITITDSTIGENLVLRGQRGDDEINLDDLTTVEGEIEITGGPGKDQVNR